MEREFENLENQLDNANLNDIMPSFDKDAGWAGLQEKLDDAEKKRIIPIWFRYAAVVVGLLLGGLLIKQLVGGNNLTPQVAVHQNNATTLPQAIIVNQPKEHLATHTEQKQSAAVAIVKEKRKIAPIIKEVEIEQKENNKVITELQEELTPKNVVEKMVAKQKEIVVEEQVLLRRKVVHLLDIDNEDREVVLSNPASSSSSFQHIMKQVAHTHTMSPNTIDQPILLRKMLKK